jgi:hypothetical protein
MVRPLALALAAALLLPCGAFAEPPRAPEAVLSAASLWLVDDWGFEERIDHPDHGPGLARGRLEFRADATMEMTAGFTPCGHSEPPPDLTFRMTAGWWIENASDLGMRVRLEEVMVSEGGEAPRPGDLVTEVMNLNIGRDGSLSDVDDGLTWRRRDQPTSPPPPPSP